uniref:Uncharacterized protein n=1 Tax=Phlebotomus papatasi TaxID=29031 RepID=A0A1B0DFJ7_PHLPP
MYLRECYEEGFGHEIQIEYVIDDQSGIESVGWWLLTQQPLDEVSQVPISWHIFCVAGNLLVNMREIKRMTENSMIRNK